MVQRKLYYNVFNAVSEQLLHVVHSNQLLLNLIESLRAALPSLWAQLALLVLRVPRCMNVSWPPRCCPTARLFPSSPGSAWAPLLSKETLFHCQLHSLNTPPSSSSSSSSFSSSSLSLDGRNSCNLTQMYPIDTRATASCSPSYGDGKDTFETTAVDSMCIHISLLWCQIDGCARENPQCVWTQKQPGPLC